MTYSSSAGCGGSSREGPAMAKPTSSPSAVATRVTASDGSSNRCAKAALERSGDRPARKSAGMRPAYVSRHTWMCTRPNASASSSRAGGRVRRHRAGQAGSERVIAASSRSSLACISPDRPGRMSALSTSETRSP